MKRVTLIENVLFLVLSGHPRLLPRQLGFGWGCEYVAIGRNGAVLKAQGFRAKPDCQRPGIRTAHAGRQPFPDVVIRRPSFGAIAYSSRRNCKAR